MSIEITNQLNQLLTQDLQTSNSLNQVFEILYPEIKVMANIQLNRLKAGKTITPTVLVNECYLKLSNPSNLSFENREHFIFTVARCMRQFLVDRIKNNLSQKRAAQYDNQCLTNIIGDDDINIQLLDLDSIINKLDQINPKLSKLLILRFFSGNSLIEIAEIQGVSKSTIIRQWNMAKTYLSVLKDEI